ncbi:TIR domain-containing protein [Saccharothrix violaceirubra]|uniref:TIR domain-containing protein n=1 Tax=Saccharothrix violaceirubra TaxID=413306 RepID=A0A7W7T2Q2_9PSEU|nr:TIR domain-containing protein [Saccharothrix violaceirubra]MBB4965515.1 hypothetical protein [Saccharothrix violaceirubra]
MRVFLSFAKKDAKVADRLWKLLDEATAVDRVYEFRLWRFDEAILIGDDWDTRIRQALAVSELGVLALSNAFLGSGYITGVELPALVDVPGKHAFPLALRPVGDHTDWKGLDAKQIHGFRKPFEQVRGAARRDEWVNALVDQFHRVLTRDGKVA